jgi:hypothetical protein
MESGQNILRQGHVVTARIGRQDMDIIQNGSRVLVPLRILEQNIMAHAKSIGTWK